MFDILSIGEILIDMFPAEVGRRLVEVSAFSPKPGGACANVAVAAARLGRSSAFIGKVGNDPFGQFLVDTLRNNNVETRGMRFDEKQRTTLAIIAMPDENSAEFMFYRNPGADLCLRAEELDQALLEQCRVLHCGSLLLVDEPARAAQYAAVEIAKKSGALISFDVNHRPALWSDQNAALNQIMKMAREADVLKVNEHELALLTGSDDPAQGCGQLLKEGISLVAVTLGRKGAYYCTSDCQGHVPPFEVDTVDAIGCGDAFVAGLLTVLSGAEDWRIRFRPEDYRRMFTYANAVGALTALERGVIPALPTAARVDAFLREHKTDY